MTTEEFLDRLEGVRQSGAEWIAKCPAHQDDTASLGVSSTDEGVTLINCYAGCKAVDVVTALGLRMSDLYPKRNGNGNGNGGARTTYLYRDEGGALAYEVVRGPGKKFRQRRPAPGGGWAWGLNGGDYAQGASGDWYRPNDRTRETDRRITLPAQARILYRLPEVLAAIERGETVYVVEGEKDVATLERLGLVATTNSGGAGKWTRAFSSVLARAARVVVLPDNDDPGRAHAEIIAAQVPGAIIVQLPGLPPKGDVTDWAEAGGTTDQLQALATREPGPDVAPVSPPPPPPPSTWRQPFVALGFSGGDFYFLPEKTGQVIALSATALGSPVNLFWLADIAYWEAVYGGETGKPSWKHAASALVAQCHAAGVFDPARIRGRGAWMDEGRAIVHQGGEVVVDGSVGPLRGVESRYFYTRALPLSLVAAPPLSTTKVRRVFDVATAIRWTYPVAAYLFSGWLANAPICGALGWRPHIWVTGGAGSGKSWVMDNVVTALLGGVALCVQSASTEAGIRQTLGQDALPVVFDEAEGEDERAQASIQRVMELARQASSDSGAAIVKGSAGGAAMRFRTRSMFCWSSIGVTVHRRADVTRVSVLEIAQPDPDHRRRAEHFAILRELVKGFTPDFCAGFVARACALAAVARDSCGVFVDAADRVVGTRRMADQIGTLFAGAWMLRNDRVPTPEEADVDIGRFCLEPFLPPREGSDEDSCLSHILDQRVRAETANGSPCERTLGELVDSWRAPQNGDDLAIIAATLRRHGLSPRDEGLMVSTSHAGVKALLKGTPWGEGWARHLARLPGAESPRNPVRFGGHQTKATLVPWTAVEVQDGNGGKRAQEGAPGHEDLF